MRKRTRIIGLGSYGSSIVNAISEQHLASASSLVAIDSDYRNLSRMKCVRNRVLLGEGKGAIGTLASFDFGLALAVHYRKKIEPLFESGRNIIVTGSGATGWGISRILIKSGLLKRSALILQMPFWFEGTRRMIKAAENLRLAKSMKIRTIALNEDKTMKNYRGKKGMNENNLFDKARQEFIEKIKEVYHEEKLLR